MINQDPSVSNSNQLYVDIVNFFNLFKVYSIDFFKMMGNFLEALNFNQLFLNLNWFICN